MWSSFWNHISISDGLRALDYLAILIPPNIGGWVTSSSAAQGYPVIQFHCLTCGWCCNRGGNSIVNHCAVWNKEAEGSGLMPIEIYIHEYPSLTNAAVSPSVVYQYTVHSEWITVACVVSYSIHTFTIVLTGVGITLIQFWQKMYMRQNWKTDDCTCYSHTKYKS